MKELKIEKLLQDQGFEKKVAAKMKEKQQDKAKDRIDAARGENKDRGDSMRSLSRTS